MPEAGDLQWLLGRKALGEVCGWKKEEVRLVTELGYTLARQGCGREALAIFEGLAALSPSNSYFQSAAGALLLRLGENRRAIERLTYALSLNERDLAALVNRGEAFMCEGEGAAAVRDLRKALSLAASVRGEEQDTPSIVRARALLEHLLSLDETAPERL